MTDRPSLELPVIDRQLEEVQIAREAPSLSEKVWPRIATEVYSEVVSLSFSEKESLRQALMIPPQLYVKELDAFERWMKIANRSKENPYVVRAQVITELYMSFVWLRDSVMKPVSDLLEPGAFRTVYEFLNSGKRRHLRNAIAHGHWCYLPDFSGLEYWAKPSNCQPHERYQIDQSELDLWQRLSRGTAIALLLGLTQDAHPGAAHCVQR